MTNENKKSFGMGLIIALVLVGGGLLFFIVRKPIVNFFAKREILRIDPSADVSQCGKMVDGYEVVCNVKGNLYEIGSKIVIETGGSGTKRTQIKSTSVMKIIDPDYDEKVRQNNRGQYPN